MTIPCPKCGGVMKRFTFYDGPRGGGHKITCAECGHVLERQEHWRDEDNETTY